MAGVPSRRSTTFAGVIAAPKHAGRYGEKEQFRVRTITYGCHDSPVAEVPNSIHIGSSRVPLDRGAMGDKECASRLFVQGKKTGYVREIQLATVKMSDVGSICD
jgi:hypothetical protein